MHGIHLATIRNVTDRQVCDNTRPLHSMQKLKNDTIYCVTCSSQRVDSWLCRLKYYCWPGFNWYRTVDCWRRNDWVSLFHCVLASFTSQMMKLTLLPQFPGRRLYRAYIEMALWVARGGASVLPLWGNFSPPL